MKQKETLIKRAISLCLIILVAIAVFFIIKGWIDGHFSSNEAFQAYVESFGIWAPLVLMLIQFCLTITPVCTSFTGCVVGAVLFGAAGGFWTNYISICVGSIAAYFLARHYGIQLVNKMVSMKKYEAYIEKINRSKSYPNFLFFAILLPLAPDNFLCYFSGLVDMPAKKFITIILAAKPWCILVYSIFFSYFL